MGLQSTPPRQKLNIHSNNMNQNEGHDAREAERVGKPDPQAKAEGVAREATFLSTTAK